MDELLDVVNKNDEVVGQATRAECHNNPKLIHRVSHCWIFNSKGQVLWQQRSLLKDTSPGKWDMSCGGHVSSGESAKETLIRELEEELGISGVVPILVEKYIRGMDKQTEMINLFYALVDKKEHEFVLQKEEVEQVRWFDYEDALKLYFDKDVAATDFIITQVPKILSFTFRKHLDL